MKEPGDYIHDLEAIKAKKKAKRGMKVSGEASKERLDRPARKCGGRVGANNKEV